VKQILVISGKGGTGKTILTASFASLAPNKIMVDCDVDAADLHLILHPEVKHKYDFKSGKTAKINKDLCVRCDKCVKLCRFEAIEKTFIVNRVSCEGCGLCSRICPAGAIEMEENNSGEWYISDTKYGPLVHAKLGIAQENSGKLVVKIRQAAKELAEKQIRDYVIIDGPPGIGCPVIASLSGVDTAVIVTEPTFSGLHDMKRVLELAGHFKIACMVVINKYDLNTEMTQKIEGYCKTREIPVAGKIPFSQEVSKSIVNGMPAVEYCKNGVSEEIIKIWGMLKC